MKRLLIFILLFISYTTFAQVKVNSEGDIIPTGIYPAVKSNNLKGTIHSFKTITERNALPANFRDTGMIAYVTDSAKFYYLYNGITNTDWRDLFKASSALTSGLLSTGNISLVDSTLTINDTIQYSINGTDYVQLIPSTFIVNSADSGYYRKDLIYADSNGLHKLIGKPDTSFGVAPKLPRDAITITTVDIYGKQIVPPVPTIITPVPNLQQVTDQGNSTTNPIFINSNNIQTPLRITANRNRSNYLYFKNQSSDVWANTGFLFKNDVSDDPNNEHTGHFLQMYMGSTNSAFSKDGGLIRSNGTGGIRVALDSGKFVLGTGSPSTGNYTSRFEMGTDGNLSFLNYKNNTTLDSVLATDQNGKVIMKKVNVGDIDVIQNTIDSSSFGIKKLDGTVKNVVVYADGLTGVSGTGIQSIQAGTNVTVDNTDPLNPVVSATGSGSSERFGIEDNTGVQNRIVRFGGFNLNQTFGDDSNYINNEAEFLYDSTGLLGYAQNLGGINQSFLNFKGDNITLQSVSGDESSNLYMGEGTTELSSKTGLDQAGIFMSSGFPNSVSIRKRHSGTVLSDLIFPDATTSHFIPLSVNGNYADNTGNITISTGGGSTYTASNGLTMVGSDVQLGGTLAGNTSIDNGAYHLILSGDKNGDLLSLINTNILGTGLSVTASGSVGTGIQSTGGNLGIYGLSIDGNGVQGESTNGYGGVFKVNPLGVTGVAPILQLIRATSGTATNDISGSIEFYINSTSQPTLANSIISKWTDATDASRTSEFSITGVSNAVTNTLLTLSGSGSAKLDKYGSGTFTGTPTYNLAVNSNGDIIEVATGSGGGGTYTASNGLSMVGSDIQLGGNLTKETTINNNGYYLNISTNGNDRTSIMGGVLDILSNSGSSPIGAVAYNSSAVAAQFEIRNSVGNDIVASFDRRYSTTTSVGDSTLLSFQLYNSDYSSNPAQIKWGRNSYNSLISDGYIKIVANYENLSNSSRSSCYLKLTGSGKMILSQAPPQYIDNAAAITAGEEIGTIYTTNGEDLKIVH